MTHSNAWIHGMGQTSTGSRTGYLPLGSAHKCLGLHIELARKGEVSKNYLGTLQTPGLRRDTDHLVTYTAESMLNLV